MNQSFLRLNDSILKSGLLSLNNDLTRELKQVTETFVHLAQTANPDDEDASDEAADAEIDPASELHKATAAARTSHRRQTSQQQSPMLNQDRADIGLDDMAAFTNPTTSASSYSAIYEPSTYVPDPPGFNVGSRLVQTRPNIMAQRQALDRKRREQPLNNEPLPFGLVELFMRDPSPKSFQTSAFPTMLPSPDLTPPPTRLATPPSLSRTLETILPMTKDLQPPYTYNFQETTFARRMARSAIEAGFKMLSQAHSHPTLVKEIFKLSLPFHTVDELLERFKRALSRGPHESLDCWEAPFIHLGGAGTHYPRKDAFGNVIPVPNSWNVRSIGPLKKTIVVENPSNPAEYHSLSVDLGGLDGEWFDAYDVQGYLEEEKGLFINAQDSFAEFYMEVEDDMNFGAGSLGFSTGTDINLFPDQSPTLSNASSSSTSPASDSSATTNMSFGSGMDRSNTTTYPFGIDINGSTFNQFERLSEVDFTFDASLGLDGDVNFGTNTLKDFGGNMVNMGLNFTRTAEEALPVVKQKTKRPVLVDVTKLIEGKISPTVCSIEQFTDLILEIVSRGICLGRAPGFRRKDVDLALKIAVIQAY